jgi:hypothetical protein
MTWRTPVMGVGLGLILLGVTDCRVKATNDLTQREVVLGDGTKATCVIVREAGVTCIPHVVNGPDAEGG